MKKEVTAGLAVSLCLCLLLLSFCNSGQTVEKPVNLIQNPSFEADQTSWHLAGGVQRVTTLAHSGKYSLRYANRNPGAYNLITQSFSVQPGQKVIFSAWLKGKEITTKDLWAAKGAGIYVQGYDASNKYIKGAFPFCLTGTFNWRQVKGVYLVPENVTRITVGLYMQRKTTGTVWFDDVSVQAVDPALFDAFLKYPGYRGTVTAQDTRPWEMVLKYNIPSDWGKTSLKSSILDGNKQVLFNETYTLKGKTASQVISWKHPASLKTGHYLWQLKLVSSDGEERLQKRVPLEVVPGMSGVYIDEQGFTVVNGKRFFPLGIYLGKGPKQGNWASSGDNLNQIARAGFNTVLSYNYGDQPDASGFLQAAGAHGLSVIYNLGDIYDGAPNYTKLTTPADQTVAALVNRLKGDSHLLAWYTGDELGSGQVQAAKERYEQLIKLDPNHPVYQVSNDLDVVPLFYPATDITGTDPYPVSGNSFSSLSQVSLWTDKTKQAYMDIKPVWEVLQIFDKNYANARLASHPPNLNEMRNMSYQALISGAKGLMYYAYHWLWYGRDNRQQKVFSANNFDNRWPDVQKMITEIKGVTPYILSGTNINLPSSSNDGVQYRAWQVDNKILLILANPNNQSKTLSLTVPAGWHVEDHALEDVKTVFQNQRLELSLGPLASGTLLLTK